MATHSVVDSQSGTMPTSMIFFINCKDCKVLVDYVSTKVQSQLALD